MKVLERYILRRVLLQAAGATAATLGIVWTVQALTKVNLVTNTGQSIGRLLTMVFLSSAFLGLGYFLALFTEKKQALHDLVAGTVVVKV